MALNLSTVLPDSAVVLGARPSDWREAVRVAGEALVRSGCTTEPYTRAMVQAVEDLGPYIVIAPGIAIAHARPSEAVVRSGLSWVRLAVPVNFGHTHNDPVHLVIGLAARNPQDHLKVMSAVAGALADKKQAAALAAASKGEQIRAILAASAG